MSVLPYHSYPVDTCTIRLQVGALIDAPRWFHFCRSLNERRLLQIIEEQYRKSPINARRSEPRRLFLYRQQ
jgi:hypothetical protein